MTHPFPHQRHHGQDEERTGGGEGLGDAGGDALEGDLLEPDADVGGEEGGDRDVSSHLRPVDVSRNIALEGLIEDGGKEEGNAAGESEDGAPERIDGEFGEGRVGEDCSDAFGEGGGETEEDADGVGFGGFGRRGAFADDPGDAEAGEGHAEQRNGSEGFFEPEPGEEGADGGGQGFKHEAVSWAKAVDGSEVGGVADADADGSAQEEHGGGDGGEVGDCVGEGGGDDEEGDRCGAFEEVEPQGWEGFAEAAIDDGAEGPEGSRKKCCCFTESDRHWGLVL